MTLILDLNGTYLEVETDEAVATMLDVASGGLDEAGLSSWLVARLED